MQFYPIRGTGSKDHSMQYIARCRIGFISICTTFSENIHGVDRLIHLVETGGYRSLPTWEGDSRVVPPAFTTAKINMDLRIFGLRICFSEMVSPAEVGFSSYMPLANDDELQNRLVNRMASLPLRYFLQRIRKHPRFISMNWSYS